MPDVIVIGAGPAGLSAALTLRSRGKSVLLLESPGAASALAKAEKVDNYPGLPAIGGGELLGAMREQALSLGAEFLSEKALAVMPMGDRFYVSAGQETLEARSLILAAGAARGKTLPGEEALLGMGVSYCATCDGMLYRGKNVAVLGFSADAEEEAEFLRSIGCNLRFFSAEESKKARILGENRVEGVEIGGEIIPFDGVFVLRDTVAPQALLPGLELQGVHIAVQPDMRTSVSGVFAAGDCVGTPYQIAKAVGEGNIAALSAAKYLDQKAKEKIN
ncbi:MAG: FAD-dependent oxidoreductase [Oscillospiraceae bacterium]|nr:FAD-dependent oxidoreductase [Oscillospiraceae bacterium]